MKKEQVNIPGPENSIPQENPILTSETSKTLRYSDEELQE
ncbi:MAG: hypothetical protein JWO32_884, partial [Bacteroidetes bacterium]|nr:hypothetical protein [Bacteroidota bacterium]